MVIRCKKKKKKMSLYSKDTVHVIAQQNGIVRLNDDVAKRIVPDVEYRIRDVIEEALKFMHASKRLVMLPQDIAAALRVRSIEPLTTPEFKSSLSAPTGGPFVPVMQAPGLFYHYDPIIPLAGALSVQTVPSRKPITIAAHWLAVDGVQPDIQQNGRPPTAQQPQTPEERVAVSARKRDRERERDKEEDKIVVRAKVKDVLGQEQRQLLDLVMGSVRQADPALPAFHASLKLLAQEPLGPLVPYLVRFIAEEVVAGLGSEVRLRMILRFSRALCLNEQHAIELYLHQLLPALLTLVLAVTNSVPDNEIRLEAAHTVAYLCRKFGGLYDVLISRVSSTYVKALTRLLKLQKPSEAADDEPASATAGDVGSLFGALCGIRELGPFAIHSLLLAQDAPVRMEEFLAEHHEHLDVVLAYRDCARTYLRMAAVESKSGQPADAVLLESLKRRLVAQFGSTVTDV